MTPGDAVALLRSVEVRGRIVDVRLDGDRIGRIGAPGEHLEPLGDGHVLEGEGGALLPGLHDHHLHLRSLAAERTSVSVGPPAVRNRPDLESALGQADRALSRGAWIRAIGYHESVAGDLDCRMLDALVPTRPVRVQHRSGALWILNTAALAAVGEPDHTDGRLFRQDQWLRERVPHQDLDLADVGRVLTSFGVTAVTDATPFETAGELVPLADAVTSGALPQRVTVMGAPSLDPSDVPPQLRVGPAKLLLPDHELPPLDEVVEAIRTARAHGRAVAVHCVTREALALTVAALDAAGGSHRRSAAEAWAGQDRIEHGAVVPPDLLAEVVRLGLVVVTQPNLVAERGDDYLALVDPADLPHLWPCRSLLDAGVPVLAGTDAPFGRPDPWALVAAAVERRTEGGAVLGPDERIAAETALALLLPPPANVRPGDPADLCVLAGSRATTRASPRRARVVATVIAGLLVGPELDPEAGQANKA